MQLHIMTTPNGIAELHFYLLHMEIIISCIFPIALEAEYFCYISHDGQLLIVFF